MLKKCKNIFTKILFYRLGWLGGVSLGGFLG
jgi:hypothetical protein